MNKRLLLIFYFFLIFINSSFASEEDLQKAVQINGIDNDVVSEKYPCPSKVAPCIKDDETFIVKGSVEKNIDITLNECIRFALGNNPRIRESMEDVIASDARVGQTWSSYFPRVTWQTGYTRIRQLQLSDVFGENLIFDYYVLGQVSLSQMLYDFGVTQNKVTLKKLEQDAYKTRLTAVINDVIRDVKNAYFNLLYAYDRRDVAVDTVEKFELFYKQAKVYYEIGTNPKVDVTIAEVNLSNSKLELIQATNAVDIAVANLNNALGLPYMTQYNVKERLKFYPVSITLDEAMQISKDSRPDLLILEKKVEAARQNFKLSKKAYFPQLSLEGQYVVGGGSPLSNYGYNVGGYLNFPTVNGMLIKNQIKEARAFYDREAARAETARNNIHLEIQKAFYVLDEKKNQIPVAFLNVKKSKENYDLSSGRYSVGVGSPTELKDAQVTYQKSQLTYYSALYQYNTAKAELERAIGKNLVDSDSIIELEK